MTASWATEDSVVSGQWSVPLPAPKSSWLPQRKLQRGCVPHKFKGHRGPTSPIPHQGDSKPESYRWEAVGQVGKQHGRRKRSEFRIRKTWGPRLSPTSRAGTDSSFSMPFSSA